MKRVLMALYLVLVATGVHAEDPTKTWLEIIKTCNPSQTIGSHVLFFGLSGGLGPGSVWRLADDKSLRIQFDLSDPFPDPPDQSKMIHPGGTVVCVADTTRDWNVKFGLPFSLSADSISAQIGAVLGSAKRVQISIKGASIDLLKEGMWTSSFQALPLTNPFVMILRNQSNLLLAENVVKVTGLTVTFSYDTALSGDIQLKFKNKSITIADPGTSTSSPASGASSSHSASPPGKSSGSTGSTGSGSTGSGSTSAGSSGIGSAAAGSACSKPLDSSSSSPAANTTPASGGGLTLHGDITNNKQIVLCADGPFYVLAEYSRVVGTIPVGIAPGAGLTILVTPLTTPFASGTTVNRSQR